MQTELRLYVEDRPVLEAKSGLRESVLVNRLLVCKFSGCEMTRQVCYMTRSITHHVHDHDFETPWLLYVNREQIHFFRCILTTFY